MLTPFPARVIAGGDIQRNPLKITPTLTWGGARVLWDFYQQQIVQLSHFFPSAKHLWLRRRHRRAVGVRKNRFCMISGSLYPSRVWGWCN